MADLIPNNTEKTAVNLGTISYDTGGTNFNIYKTDSINSSAPSNDSSYDPADYFIIDTTGLSEVKVDIHPILPGSDYNYSLSYYIDNNAGERTIVNLYGDGGSQDGFYEKYRYDSTPGELYNGKDNYFVSETTNYLGNKMTTYTVYDETYFNYSFDPHLVIDTASTDELHIAVISGQTSTYDQATWTYDELSYVIDVTPISSAPSTMTAAESHLSSYGVTMTQAKDFIMNNIADLTLIYNTCKTYGVTHDMIAEILQTTFPGLDGTTVANYFATNGINSTDLGGSAPTISVVTSIPATNDSNSSIDTSNATHIGIGTPVFVKNSEQYSDEYGDYTKTFSISYDSTTNSVIQTDQNGNSTHIQFDSNGKEAKVITDNSTTSYTYDSQGRITQEKVDFGNNHTIVETYTYNGSNVTIKAPDSYSGFTDIAHGTIDSNGNIVSLGWAWGYDGDTQIDQMQYFTYDSHGNELTKSIDNNLDGTIDSTSTYEWGLFI